MLVLDGNVVWLNEVLGGMVIVKVVEGVMVVYDFLVMGWVRSIVIVIVGIRRMKFRIIVVIYGMNC